MLYNSCLTFKSCACLRYRCKLSSWKIQHSNELICCYFWLLAHVLKTAICAKPTANVPTSRRLNVVVRSPPSYERWAEMARQLLRGVRPSGCPQSSRFHFYLWSRPWGVARLLFSAKFFHAPIPRKGSGSTTITTANILRHSLSEHQCTPLLQFDSQSEQSKQAPPLVMN